MKENKLTIVIEKPIEEIFQFTLNPKNTPLWIPSIEEEICDSYPPKIGSIYKNRGDNSEWTSYEIVEFEENKLFTMKIVGGVYSVRYTFKKLDHNKTELEYFEWVEKGELENPVTQDILNNLKSVM